MSRAITMSKMMKDIADPIAERLAREYLNEERTKSMKDSPEPEMPTWIEEDWLNVRFATPEQWKTLNTMLSYYVNLSNIEDLQERCQKVLDNLDLLQPCNGCVPDGFTDELEQSIIRKFRIHYRMAVTLAASMLGITDTMVDVIVEPSYEDTSTIVVVLDKHVLFMTYTKAWNLEYDSLETMFNEVTDAAECIAEAWREIL